MVLMLFVAGPTLVLLYFNQTTAPPVQLDLTLVLQSTSNDLKYSANYHWAGDDIESSSSSISWEDDTAVASVSSTGQLSEAIKSYFESILISFDFMDIQESGNWNLKLTKDLTSGISLDVKINGDESSITEIVPSLTVSFVPHNLAIALQNVGIDEVRVDVTISFHIKGEIIEEAANSLGIVLGFYTGLLEKSVDATLDTISSLTS